MSSKIVVDTVSKSKNQSLFTLGRQPMVIHKKTQNFNTQPMVQQETVQSLTMRYKSSRNDALEMSLKKEKSLPATTPRVLKPSLTSVSIDKLLGQPKPPIYGQDQQSNPQFEDVSKKIDFSQVNDSNPFSLQWNPSSKEKVSSIMTMGQGIKNNLESVQNRQTLKVLQYLDQSIQVANKESVLKPPPSISDIDLQQVYWDLMWQRQIQKQKTIEKRTDTDIVTVVFVRHGQSMMNKEGIFQGWADAPLSEEGQSQSREAGKLLKKLGYHFDVAYTSKLCRAIDTTDLILEEMGLLDSTHTHKTWRLNERHYGVLQGKSKKLTCEEYGKEQVQEWRQSFDNPPPEIDYDHPDHPRFDELYKGLSEEEYHQMPVGESLKMVRERIENYWKDQVMPSLKNMGGKKILFSTHKHVLRAMVQYLEELDAQQIPKLIIPNASPFVFEFDLSQDMKVVRNYYVEDETKPVFENQKEDEALFAS